MKKTIPEISIIICCYNHEKWIERCLRSILHQKNIKDSEYEVIIIDDNSQDKTIQIIKKYKSKKIKLYVRKKIRGFASALIYGIKKNFLMRL